MKTCNLKIEIANITIQIYTLTNMKIEILTTTIYRQSTFENITTNKIKSDKQKNIKLQKKKIGIVK